MSLRQGAFDPMLSRKQAWRKTKSYGCNPNFNGTLQFCGAGDHVDSEDNEDEENLTSIDSGYVSDGCKENATTPTPIKKLRSILSMGDLSKALRNTAARNLRFSSKIHVCLIPTRQDLQSVAMEIFWSSADYATFKREAVDELRAFLQARGITAKEAIKLLYQPDLEEVHGALRESKDLASQTILEVKEGDPMIIPDECPSKDSKSANDEKEQERTDIVVTQNDIVIGYKTDLEINKESGGSTLKTPAGKGGGGTQIWAVQWQKQGAAPPAGHK